MGQTYYCTQSTGPGADRQALVSRGFTLLAEYPGRLDIDANVASCSTGYVVSEPENNPGLVEDCKTLIRLRDDLGGDSLPNWGSGVPIEEWTGVTVESIAGPGATLVRRVTKLSFVSSREQKFDSLDGRIPPDLSGWTNCAFWNSRVSV